MVREKHINLHLILIVVLAIFLVAFLLSVTFVDAQRNAHHINLNDGQPVIEYDSLSVVPSEMVTKSFFIENESDEDLYYKLYFENIEGHLGDYLDVIVQDGKEIILKGRLSDLRKSNKKIEKSFLKAHERKDLQLTFTLVRSASNEVANTSVIFDLAAWAFWV